MARITRSDLDRLAELINRRLESRGDRWQHSIGYAYGRPRLERAEGSVDVSPRLSTGELYQWMHAYLAGMDAVGSL